MLLKMLNLFKKTNFYKYHSLVVYFAITFLITQIAHAEKSDEKKAFQKGIEKASKFTFSSQVKDYFISKAKTKVEAKEIESLFYKTFGTQKRKLPTFDIKDNYIYTNNVNSGLLIKLTRNGLKVKKGQAVESFNSKDTVLTYLTKLNRIQKNNSNSASHINSFYSVAFAEEKSLGGLLIYMIFERKEPPAIWDNTSKDQTSPSRSPHYPICSSEYNSVETFIIDTFAADAPQDPRDWTKLNPGFKVAEEQKNHTKVYKDRIQIWLKKLKETGLDKKMVCDLKYYPQVNVNFSINDLNDITLSANPEIKEEIVTLRKPQFTTTNRLSDRRTEKSEVFDLNTNITTYPDGSKKYDINGNIIYDSDLISSEIEEQPDGSKILKIKYPRSKTRSTVLIDRLFRSDLKWEQTSTSSYNPSLRKPYKGCSGNLSPILNDLTMTSAEVCKYLANNPNVNSNIKVIPHVKETIEVDIPAQTPSSVLKENTVD